ncbi:Predicted arabinose efflux permease, MFS family [Sphingomonas sp. YR710]|uniref:MFS transporter n=1 Tax=Sphingomonas sp. YR710 TaxID=1882773 RepID=UPI0008844B32|nr:MFS transporter [Sphingomonas sp. YR710]SDC27681.1 Predicted arabinose efflux permease, MFS family [Sphingomonas sp. YR710]
METEKDFVVNRPLPVLALVVVATVLGLMGTDLVLPAIPTLPEALGGDPAEAQLVLAAYVGGTSIGLLAFGALGDRFATRHLLIASLLLHAVTAFACVLAPTIWSLIGLRALQGAAAAGPAVFAPAIIRAMFDDAKAVHAVGALGSIEALAPALAPIMGVWLLSIGGWRLSFELIGVIALLLAIANIAMPLIPQTSRRRSGSYGAILRDPVFLRYALSQAFVLGGLLVFVFGAPAVFVRSLGGTLSDFIIMQIAGITTFIVAANITGSLAARFGAERLIGWGTVIATFGAAGLLIYALAGGRSPLVVAMLFVPLNTGLGLRGPPGFYRAVLASRGDDARGSALVVLAIMAVTAAGTATVAGFIERGLLPLAAAALALNLAGLLCLIVLPPLREA